MKLNYKRVILVGMAFFLIRLFGKPTIQLFR